MTRETKDLIVGLDIGTSKVVAVVAEMQPDGRYEVVGLGQHESRGLKKGVVVNIETTVASIQRALEEADLERVAREAKLDLEKWQACRQDPAMEAEIKKDMADGTEAGVSGTPAFFVNGVFLNGALPFERFKAVIDRELSKG